MCSCFPCSTRIAQALQKSRAFFFPEDPLYSVKRDIRVLNQIGLMSDRQLVAALRSVIGGSVSEGALSALIHRAVGDAAAILLSRYRRYLPILRDAGYSTEAAASRCIEELFLPRDDRSCYRLAEFLMRECEQAREDIDAYCIRAFRRVVYLQVAQSLPDLLGEFDSPYKRILRLVRKCLGTNRAMKRTEGFLEDYYFRCPEERLLQANERMPHELLVGELFVRTTDSDHIAQLIAHLFDILDDQNTYRRMLTQANIVEIIRDFHAMRWEQSSVPEEQDVRFDSGDRERILKPTVDHLRRTVVQSYREKNVLDDTSAEKYLNAVKAMLEDLSRNAVLSWYVYYEREFNGHSYEKYREAERSRFEYVMGLAKKRFLAHCREYFSD